MKIPGFSLPLGEILRMVMPNIGEQNAQLTDSGGIDYTPTANLNWNLNAPPASIGAALDQLAQGSFSQNSCGVIGAAGTINYDTPAIPYLKSGNYLTIVMGNVLATNQATLTWKIRTNGGVGGAVSQQTQTTAAGLLSQCTLVTISGQVSSSFTSGLQVAASAGNVSAVAGGIVVVTVELGG